MRYHPRAPSTTTGAVCKEQQGHQVDFVTNMIDQVLLEHVIRQREANVEIQIPERQWSYNLTWRKKREREVLNESSDRVKQGGLV